MAALFDRLRATADRLVTKYGATGEILRASSGGMPWEPTPGEVSYPCRIVKDDYTAFEADGSLVQLSDAKFMIPALGLEIVPTTADRIRFAGEVYQIVSVTTTGPDGTAIVHTVQGRR